MAQRRRAIGRIFHGIWVVVFTLYAGCADDDSASNEGIVDVDGGASQSQTGQDESITEAGQDGMTAAIDAGSQDGMTTSIDAGRQDGTSQVPIKLSDTGSGDDAAVASDVGIIETGDASLQSEGEAGVRFIGRPDRREDSVVRIAWSGSGILFRFLGSEASVHLDDPGGFFTLLIDGKLEQTLETGGGERDYQIASGLPYGIHEVELYRRTEALFGTTRFFNVDVGFGELLAPQPTNVRKLEIIGNSITAGYGNEGPNEFCSFEAQTQNHYLTYGAIAARNLDAELSTIAWSGKGVIYNYGDDIIDPMPVIYPRALPNDAQSLWDFSSWQPDAVVINLGTNDFSTDNDPSEVAFASAYTEFLEQIRGYYPDAFIVCLVPTLLWGEDLNVATSYLTTLIEDMQDERIQVVTLDFTQDGWGCDYHPSLATHASMGEALTRELKAILGW